MVLFAQILGLAVQVKQGTDRGTSRLIRIWAVSAITPFSKGAVHSSGWLTDAWHNYVYLRGVRGQNRQLRDELAHLRLEQVRLAQDASQARRLQTLLGFREQFISQTMAAQVISTTGSEFSRGIYIDKGSRDGIKPDMPVITADGIVGKLLRVFPTSSLVLQINDTSSGAGVILEKTRLQGILKGSPSGETFVANIMADEAIEQGERVLTSGGDRVYPKGLPAGTVGRTKPAGTYLNVEVKPSAQLYRLEEVLVITKIVEKAPEVNDENAPVRATDILAQRLPSVPPPKPKPPTVTPQTGKPAGGTTPQPKPNAEPAAKPAPPTENVERTSVEKKETVATAAEKNAAAKAVPDPGKPETPVKDPPR